MELEPLAQKMKDFIESELGLWVEVRSKGLGWSFYPVTPTGRVIGETQMNRVLGRNPVVFVNNRGYFAGLEGRALASRFRTMIAGEVDILVLDASMRVG
jgi:hypothetical protein